MAILRTFDLFSVPSWAEHQSLIETIALPRPAFLSKVDIRQVGLTRRALIDPTDGPLDLDSGRSQSAHFNASTLHNDPDDWDSSYSP